MPESMETKFEVSKSVLGAWERSAHAKLRQRRAGGGLESAARHWAETRTGWFGMGTSQAANVVGGRGGHMDEGGSGHRGGAGVGIGAGAGDRGGGGHRAGGRLWGGLQSGGSRVFF